MAAPLVDIGANLTNRRFQKDLQQVLRRAASAGVATVLITGTSMRGSREALQLVTRNLRHRRSSGAVDSTAHSHAHSTTHNTDGGVALFATVGVHPHDAKDFDDVRSLAEMRALIAAHPGSVVAVGECGLDFNRDFSPRDVQERVFRAQVALACELGLPLFLHERDAHAAFVAVLQPFLAAQRLPPVVVHCFTGSERELRAYLAMGFYIGVTGFVCMDTRGLALRSMAAAIPRDRLLIETDAPFMYPYGNNVKARCEPKDLRAVAQTLAACYGTTPDEIAAATTANARRFFALDKREALQAAEALQVATKSLEASETAQLASASTVSTASAARPAVASASAAASAAASRSHDRQSSRINSSGQQKRQTHHPSQTHLASRRDARVPTADERKIELQSAATTTSAAARLTVATAGVDRGTDDANDSDNTVVLDGGDGEGGGQLLRVSVALAAVLGKRVRVHSVRANRSVPGLRNQHVQTLQLARELARGGSVLVGAELNSTQITFAGAPTSGAAGGVGVSGSPNGDDLDIDGTSDTNDTNDTIGTRDASDTCDVSDMDSAIASIPAEREVAARSATGGSVSLMIQGSLPVLVFGTRATTLRLSGGTHAGFSPPADFMAVPLRQLLARFGVETSLSIEKRGFTMGQIGDVAFRVSPLARGTALTPVDLSVASAAIARLYVRVTVFGASADAATGQQYERALRSSLSARLGTSLMPDTVTESDVLIETTRARNSRKPRGSKSKGGALTSSAATPAREKPMIGVLVVAETRSGGLLSVDRASNAAPATVAADVAQTLAQYVADGVCVDEHLADNAVVFMALAAGVSRLRVPARAARSSQHLETALAVVAQMAGATVRLDEGERSSIVEVHGIGWTA